MNPPGIPLFYRAFDEETALREIANKPGDYAVGCFVVKRDITILDLTQIPAIPSLFEPPSDSAEYDPRPPLRFLHGFGRDVTKPVTRDNLIHIGYVPTQVVTKYLRHRSERDTIKVEGIKYNSAKVENRANIALFARQSDLVGAAGEGIADRPWLELMGRCVRTISAVEMEQWAKTRAR